jgi:hypothetical protein
MKQFEHERFEDGFEEPHLMVLMRNVRSYYHHCCLTTLMVALCELTWVVMTLYSTCILELMMMLLLLMMVATLAMCHQVHALMAHFDR